MADDLLPAHEQIKRDGDSMERTQTVLGLVICAIWTIVVAWASFELGQISVQ